MDPTNEQSDPILGGAGWYSIWWEWVWTVMRLVNVWKITNSEQDPGHEVLAPQLHLDALSDNHLGSEMIWNDLKWSDLNPVLCISDSALPITPQPRSQPNGRVWALSQEGSEHPTRHGCTAAKACSTHKMHLVYGWQGLGTGTTCTSKWRQNKWTEY